MRLPALAILMAMLLLAAPALAQSQDPLVIGDDTEQISGHRIVLKSGSELTGLAENVEGADTFLRLKTAKGVVRCPRSEVVSIEPARLPASAVYTPEERYEMAREHFAPRSPEDHLQLSRWCLRIGAYARAAEHARQALGLAEAEGGETARRVFELAKTLELGSKAFVMKKEIERLASGGKRGAALKKLSALRSTLANEPAVQRLTGLDDLERKIRGEAISPAHATLMVRFRKILDRCIEEKLQEKGLTVTDALRWASAPDGLAAAFITELALELKLTVEEARRLWALRPLGDSLWLSYGPGGFLHPDSKQRRDALAGLVDLTTPDAWWAKAASSAKLSLLAAWFAEHSGLLEVGKVESRPCKSCGGKGMHTTHSIISSDEVRTECGACHGAGRERIVLCR